MEKLYTIITKIGQTIRNLLWENIPKDREEIEVIITQEGYMRTDYKVLKITKEYYFNTFDN